MERAVGAVGSEPPALPDHALAPLGRYPRRNEARALFGRHTFMRRDGEISAYQAGRNMLCDTPYDVGASVKAGVTVVGLRCGGRKDQDLAGAAAVYDDVRDLRKHLARSPFLAQ